MRIDLRSLALNSRLYRRLQDALARDDVARVTTLAVEAAPTNSRSRQKMAACPHRRKPWPDSSAALGPNSRSPAA